MPFSGSALSTLPKVRNHVPDKRPQLFKLGPFCSGLAIETLDRNEPAVSQAAQLLIAVLLSAVPMLTLGNSAPEPRLPPMATCRRSTEI